MFKITRRDERPNIDREIELVLKTIRDYPPDSEEYASIAKNLETLYKAKSHDRCRGVSPDTIAVIAGNLLGIALILGYEKVGVITSKALGFVMKGRV